MSRPTYEDNGRDFVGIDVDLLSEKLQRELVVQRIAKDLYEAAKALGQTDEQTTSKIDALFITFAAEWQLYTLTGSPAIATAIQNDATLAWLDTDVSGTTIRQRLINRLS